MEKGLNGDNEGRVLGGQCWQVTVFRRDFVRLQADKCAGPVLHTWGM